MEMDLSNLIEKIKAEGVSEAQKQASDITENASKEARAILEKAKKEKEHILKQAQQGTEALKKNTEETLRQAAANTILSLKERITELFDKVLKGTVEAQLSDGILKDVITKAIETLREKGAPELEIILSERDQARLEKIVLSGFSQAAQKGITFKVSPSVDKGFKIQQKGKDFYYDFTSDAISEALALYLNPKLSSLLGLTKENER